MDKFIALQKALHDFGQPAERIKMHPQDWYELTKEYLAANPEEVQHNKLLGIPVVLDPTIHVNEFVIE